MVFNQDEMNTETKTFMDFSIGLLVEGDFQPVSLLEERISPSGVMAQYLDIISLGNPYHLLLDIL